MMTILQANPYESMDAGNATGALAMGAGMMVFYLILYLFFSFCMYKIFQKAGREDAWAAFIPIYNYVVLLDILKKPIWWIILLLIPFVNIIFAIILMHRLSTFFGKDMLMTILLIILPFIGLPILAFGDAVYNPNALPDDRK